MLWGATGIKAASKYVDDLTPTLLPTTTDAFRIRGKQTPQKGKNEGHLKRHVCWNGVVNNQGIRI